MKTVTSRIALLASLAVLGALVVLFVLARPSATGWSSATPEVQAILWPGPRDVAAFRLLDQHGKTFDKEKLKGRWSLLYFGYLQCPDICPMTLQSLASVRKLMVDAGSTDIPEMIFVSVDPGNDTPQRIDSYLAFFDKQLIGLSGEPDQLEQLARSLGIIYAEHIEPNGVRSMEHTTSVIVVDPEGRGVAALAGSHQPRVMLQQLTALRAFLAR